MSITVIPHEGYRTDEYPKYILEDDRRLEVIEIESSAHIAAVDPMQPPFRRFVVRCRDGSRFETTCRNGKWRVFRL